MPYHLTVLLCVLGAACDPGGASVGADSDIPRAALRFCTQISWCNPHRFAEHWAAPAECAQALSSQMEHTAEDAEGDGCAPALVVYHDCVSDMGCEDYLQHRDDVNGRVRPRACWEYVLTVWDVCR